MLAVSRCLEHQHSFAVPEGKGGGEGACAGRAGEGRAGAMPLTLHRLHASVREKIVPFAVSVKSMLKCIWKIPLGGTPEWRSKMGH